MKTNEQTEQAKDRICVCGKSCSPHWPHCAYCGHVFFTLPAPPKPKMEVGKIIALAVSLLITAGSLIHIDRFMSSPDRVDNQVASKNADDETLRVELCERAKTAVKQHLKSPSTAKFPGVLWNADQWDILLMPDGTYVVMSHVDAQNGFGALIRSSFVVTFNPGKQAVDVVIE